MCHWNGILLVFLQLFESVKTAVNSQVAGAPGMGGGGWSADRRPGSWWCVPEGGGPWFHQAEGARHGARVPAAGLWWRRDLGPAGLPCPGSLVLCDAGGRLGSAVLLLWAVCAALRALGLCVGRELCPLRLPRLHWDTGNRVAASVQTSLGGVLGCPGSTCFSRLPASGLP